MGAVAVGKDVEVRVQFVSDVEGWGQQGTDSGWGQRGEAIREAL
jgi:hypothetical protein